MQKSIFSCCFDLLHTLCTHDVLPSVSLEKKLEQVTESVDSKKPAEHTPIHTDVMNPLLVNRIFMTFRSEPSSDVHLQWNSQI